MASLQLHWAPPGRGWPLGQKGMVAFRSLLRDTFAFYKPTFTWLECVNRCSVLSCFVDNFGDLAVLSFTRENVLPQMQLWRTMMVQAELCDSWLNFDSVTGWIWNIWGGSWILGTIELDMWHEVKIYSCDCPLWLASTRKKHNFMLEPKTKTWTVKADFIQNIFPLI